MIARAANDLDPFWMPFTANRSFKAQPRLLASARDMHYFTPDGRPILDGTAGLWCVNAGHARKPIVEAITRKTGLPISSLAMVGDRLYTDIALGQAGVMTILVLSGETKSEDLPGSPFKPDLVVPDLAGLSELIRAL